MRHGQIETVGPWTQMYSKKTQPSFIGATQPDCVKPPVKDVRMAFACDRGHELGLNSTFVEFRKI